MEGRKCASARLCWFRLSAANRTSGPIHSTLKRRQSDSDDGTNLVPCKHASLALNRIETKRPLPGSHVNVDFFSYNAFNGPSVIVSFVRPLFSWRRGLFVNFFQGIETSILQSQRTYRTVLSHGDWIPRIVLTGRIPYRAVRESVVKVNSWTSRYRSTTEDSIKSHRFNIRQTDC